MVSPRSRNIAMASLFGFLGLWYLTPVSDWIVARVLIFVPIEADIDLGRKAWRSMGYSTAPDRWNVNVVGHRLVSLLEEPYTLPWSFAVIRADIINAFALPGGIVRVSDTSLRQLNLSEAELAALIGHEMGHILHRHSQARLLQDQLIGYLFRAVFYDDNDSVQESFGEAIGELLLKSASFLGKQSFSRKNEYEADAKAWELLLISKRYSPQAVESLLKKLWDASGGSGDTSWESTHPGTKDRIDALKTKWNELPISERRRLGLLKN
ncbi:negative regulation of mitochondrial fusion [Fragilaria crotonensis]|nr:negative regulation of mitochondrial fusion [Fragilaria crotonensis]